MSKTELWKKMHSISKGVGLKLICWGGTLLMNDQSQLVHLDSSKILTTHDRIPIPLKGEWAQELSGNHIHPPWSGTWGCAVERFGVHWRGLRQEMKQEDWQTMELLLMSMDNCIC